jgi:hypothetical protein
MRVRWQGTLRISLPVSGAHATAVPSRSLPVAVATQAPAGQAPTVAFNEQAASCQLPERAWDSSNTVLWPTEGHATGRAR